MRFSASMPASFGASPRRRPSTTRYELRLYRLASPRPVDPAAPTSPSTYSPAPRIGESPARPGIFHAKPLVVVTPQISPFGLTPSQLIVPQKCSPSISPSRTICMPASYHACARFRIEVVQRIGPPLPLEPLLARGFVDQTLFDLDA